MSSLQPIRQKPVAIDLNDCSFEKMTKEFERIARLALRGHHVTIEWYKNVMEELEKLKVSQIASSHRSWAPLIGRIGAAAIGIGGSVGASFVKQPQALALLKGASKIGPEIASGGMTVYEGHQTAKRTLDEGTLQCSRRSIDDASSKMQSVAQQLHEFLEEIRRLNEEIAQSMRAVRAS